MFPPHLLEVLVSQNSCNLCPQKYYSCQEFVQLGFSKKVNQAVKKRCTAPKQMIRGRKKTCCAIQENIWAIRKSKQNITTSAQPHEFLQ